MPKEEEKITMLVTYTEKRFIETCRELGFAKFEVEVLDGQPKKMYKGIQSIRFDINHLTNSKE